MKLYYWGLQNIANTILALVSSFFVHNRNKAGKMECIVLSNDIMMNLRYVMFVLCICVSFTISVRNGIQYYHGDI